MKNWTIAALLTGMIIAPLMILRRKVRPADEQIRFDQRYAIDDLIADQPIS